MKFAVLLLGMVLAAQPRVGFVRTIGGGGEDAATAIARDVQGNLYVAGTTTSGGLGTPGTAFSSPRGANLFLQAGSGVRPVQGPLSAEVNSLAVGGPSTAIAATAAGLEVTKDAGGSWRVFFAGQRVQAAAVMNETALYVSILAGSEPEGGKAWTDQHCSLDGGETWQKLAPLESGSDAAVNVVRLSIDRRSTARIFALGTRFSGRAPNMEAVPAAYLSEDGGATWRRLPGGLTRIVFAAGETGAAYGLDFFDGVVKSSDNGRNWQPLPAPKLDWYYDILADPLDSNVVYYTGSVAGAEGGSRILRSSDGGASWVRMGSQYAADLLELAADARGRVYGRTSSTVYRSSEGLQTLTPVTPWLGSWITCFAVLPAGEVWVGTGYTSDVFISKLTPEGEIKWTTYLGGSQPDTVAAIAVDERGDVYVAGRTESFDFPFDTPAPNENNPGYVAKISGDGTHLVYALAMATGAEPRALTVDAGGSAYVAGTASTSFRTTPGVFQPGFDPPTFTNTFSRNAMVVKVSPDGSRMEFATFLGRDLSAAAAIAMDSDGELLVAGTELWKLSSDGTRLLWSTWVQGWNALAVTPLGDGRMLVCGSTRSDNLWTTPDAFQPAAPPYYGPPPLPRAPWPSVQHDAFVLETAPKGDLAWSTLLGGRSVESCLGVWQEEEGQVVVAGLTQSTDFPVQFSTEPSPGRYAGFASRLNARGASLVYSTTVSNGQLFTPARAVRHVFGGAVLAGSTRREATATEPVPDNDALIVWVAER